MRLSENIRSHERFETDRNIYDYYSIPTVFNRYEDEHQEARVELDKYLEINALMEMATLSGMRDSLDDLIEQKRLVLEAFFKELLDSVNLLLSVVLHVINELGIAPEQVDTIMGLINKSRDAKYAIEYFKSMPVDEAIQVSRDTWSMRRNGHY